MAFYDNLTELCAKNSISVNGLIVKLKMSKSNGKSWRQGAVPQAATLKKIADYFGVTVADLLEDKPKGTAGAIQGITYTPKVTIFTQSGEINPASRSNSPFLTQIKSHRYAPNKARLSENKQALIDIYDKLDPIRRARLIIYASELLKDGSESPTMPDMTFKPKGRTDY